MPIKDLIAPLEKSPAKLLDDLAGAAVPSNWLEQHMTSELP